MKILDLWPMRSFLAPQGKTLATYQVRVTLHKRGNRDGRCGEGTSLGSHLPAVGGGGGGEWLTIHDCRDIAVESLHLHLC